MDYYNWGVSWLSLCRTKRFTPMQENTSGTPLLDWITRYPDTTKKNWLLAKIQEVTASRSARELYISFSLCSTRLDKNLVDFSTVEEDQLVAFFRARKATEVEVGRIALLISSLESDPDFYGEKVQKLLQIADSQELVTILKYLVVLPNPVAFCNAAVDALRTNIADVFDAITLNNPYPGQYFNEQQWNQMYLKAAFMQRDLSKILDVERRANRELARIISDYAHERWAASRDIDPEIWRPVSNFLEGVLVRDIKRLFDSTNPLENRAAALVCYHADSDSATTLLKAHPALKRKLENKSLTWQTIKK